MAEAPPEPYRFDLDAIVAELALPQPLEKAQWLEESYRDPTGFMSALCDYHAGRFTPAGKSNLVGGFDLYCDAVLRHASPLTERVALRLYDREHGLRTMTYAELHERAGRLSTALRERGIKPGQPVCFMLHFGESFVVALFAALRVGATVTYLPPLGERYVARRLAAIKPAAVITERLYQRLCAPFPAVLITDSAQGFSHDSRSHTYPPPAPCLALLSPLRDPPWLPVKVPANVAYLRALRDALCVYGLRPGDGLCAPGWHVLQHQPALLFSALLAGATFIDIEPAALGRDPGLLQRLGVTCLGVNNATRDALRKAPQTSLPTLKSWFRTPLEPFFAEAWRDFLTKHGLAAIPNFNVHIDAASGGAQLFSSRAVKKVVPTNYTLPTAGVEYKLANADLSGQKAPGHYGVFLPAGEKKESGFLILSRGSEGYFVGGTRTPRRDGHFYSHVEVEEVVKELPFVEGAATLALPEPGDVNRFLFILLIFTGDIEEPKDGRLQLERHISLQLSPEHLPDVIEVYRLYPRKVKGDAGPIVDADWCRMQYQTGMLFKKTQRKSGQLLTALRRACEELSPIFRAGSK